MTVSIQPYTVVSIGNPRVQSKMDAHGSMWTVIYETGRSKRAESGRWSFEINSYHLDWSKLVKILEYGSDVILILLKFVLTLKSFILRTSEITLRRSSLSLYSIMIQSKCKNL